MENTEENELISAAKEKDIERVRRALESGVPVNFQGKGGMTALHVAAAQGNSGLVRYLFEQDIDPTFDLFIMDHFSFPAITHARYTENDELVAYMEEKMN